MQLSDFSKQGYQNFEQVPLLELLFFIFILRFQFLHEVVHFLTMASSQPPPTLQT